MRLVVWPYFSDNVFTVHKFKNLIFKIDAFSQHGSQTKDNIQFLEGRFSKAVNVSRNHNFNAANGSIARMTDFTWRFEK